MVSFLKSPPPPPRSKYILILIYILVIIKEDTFVDRQNMTQFSFFLYKILTSERKNLSPSLLACSLALRSIDVEEPISRRVELFSSHVVVCVGAWEKQTRLSHLILPFTSLTAPKKKYPPILCLFFPVPWV